MIDERFDAESYAESGSAYCADPSPADIRNLLDAIAALRLERDDAVRLMGESDDENARLRVEFVEMALVLDMTEGHAAAFKAERDKWRRACEDMLPAETQRQLEHERDEARLDLRQLQDTVDFNEKAYLAATKAAYESAQYEIVKASARIVRLENALRSVLPHVWRGMAPAGQLSQAEIERECAERVLAESDLT